MAPITGAFLVGLFLARTPYRERIEQGMATLAYGFFVPVFFVNIGLESNMRDIAGSALLFAVAITLVAIVSKILGSGLGSLLGGLTSRESLQLGIGMVSRGEVGLIVASTALAANVMNEANFAISVFMVIIATLVTPPLLRLVFVPEEEAIPVAGER